MKTLETVQQAGPDRLLRLTIPVDEPNRPYRVVVVYEPEQAANQSTADQSTADQSTANQSTANQSTANQSTANQSTANQSTANQSTALGWPEDFEEQTAGAWQGDFPLDSEGEFEERVSLE